MRTAPQPCLGGQPFDHLLWIQTAFLGDIVLTTGAINLAATLWPQVQQHIITTPTGANLLRNCLFNDRPLAGLHVLDKQRASGLALARQLRRHFAKRQGVCLQPHRSARSSLLAKVVGWPTITYEESFASRLLARKRVPRVAVLHECSRIGLLLEPLGVPRERLLRLKPFLSTRPAPTHQGIQVGIAPGSVWPTKRWPVTNFAAAIAALQRQLPLAKVLLFGAPNEKALTRQLHERLSILCPTLPVEDLAGQIPIGNLAQTFQELDLIISGDSAPMHLASAIDLPAVAIFGPTAPQLGFSPLSTRARVVEAKHLSCRPCSPHGPKTCPLKHFRCMHNISPHEVARACYDILTSKAPA